jgi:hypothetical protein
LADVLTCSQKVLPLVPVFSFENFGACWHPRFIKSSLESQFYSITLGVYFIVIGVGFQLFDSSNMVHYAGYDQPSEHSASRVTFVSCDEDPDAAAIYGFQASVSTGLCKQ